MKKYIEAIISPIMIGCRQHREMDQNATKMDRVWCRVYQMQKQLNRHVKDAAVHLTERLDEALVNAEFAIDKLIGPNQEISFIAKDATEDLAVVRKERILNAMRTTTKQITAELSGSVSNQILHENLRSHDSLKINEENEKARQEILRRDILYETFHRWKLTLHMKLTAV